MPKNVPSRTLGGGVNKCYKTQSRFKKLEHFDADFVCDECMVPYVLRALNSKQKAKAYEHKSLYPIIYSKIPQPKYFVNCINGVFFNSEMNIVSKEECINILEKEGEFIIKPTHNSAQGANVKKAVVSNRKDVIEILDYYGKDFIAQEIVKQSEITKQFNESSLNTFRITTLNINGEASLCNILFRCGQGNVCVDNGAAGGLMIGVSKEGEYREYGYDKFYNKHFTTRGGLEFKGIKVPGFDNIVNQVVGWHAKYLPLMGLCGWDIALDENNNPVMIEINLFDPGAQFEQLSNGTPLFGNRTKEVIEYIKNKRLQLGDIL